MAQESHPDSLWQATAPPAPSLPELGSDIETEVAIVGGGYTGLAAARHLLRAAVPCVVVEANDVGWGASGRNGGFAVPRFKKGFAALDRAYGIDMARRLHAGVLEAIDEIERTVADFGLDCGFARCGHLLAAHSKAALADIEADTRWLESQAGDRTPRVVSAGQAAEETGVSWYRGGLLDPRGAVVQPLAYARSFARALADRGVPIYVGTPVHRIGGDSTEVVVETPGGRIRARHVILATNAYSDICPTVSNLHRRIVPVASSVIATAPLDPNVRRRIVPARRAVSDTKHLLHWYRMLDDGRLIFGGRGDITGRRDDPSVYRGLEEALGRTFPSLGTPQIAYRWSGFVAITLDGFPHIGHIGERIFYALGYGGRGVALSHLLGKYLASTVQGKAVDAGPMEHNPFRPIIFHGFRVPMLRLASVYYGMRDAASLRT